MSIVQRIQQEGKIAEYVSEIFSVLSTWLTTQIKTSNTEIRSPFGFQLNLLITIIQSGFGMTSAVKNDNVQHGEMEVTGLKLSSVMRKPKRVLEYKQGLQLFVWKWWLTRCQFLRRCGFRSLTILITTVCARTLSIPSWKPKSKSILRMFQTLNIFLLMLKTLFNTLVLTWTRP